jgi:hypothetical protein
MYSITVGWFVQPTGPNEGVILAATVPRTVTNRNGVPHMKAIICGVVILALASLAEAQIGAAGERPLALSCEQFSMTYHQKYFLDTVRAGLKAAMLERELSPTDPGIQNLGDAASVAVLKVVATKDLTTPKMVRAYLQVVRTAFSQPHLMIACVEDKELQRQIDSTKEYVLRRAPLGEGHGD